MSVAFAGSLEQENLKAPKEHVNFNEVRLLINLERLRTFEFYS